ncbi:MAG: EamA family transporter [Candidatus Kapabacteria bacterium]|nr:EamA family transporter [Candidatus Kapabacteria bacterium]
MSLLAVLLVLSSAVIHAVWNLQAKKVGGGLPFVLLTGIVSTVLYLPVVIPVWIYFTPVLDLQSVLLIGTGAMIHLVYFMLLMRGYRHGEMSVVYPLARGTGPALTMIFAALFFDEVPTPGAVVGMILIGSGVVILSVPMFKAGLEHLRKGIVYALCTGFLIALYTTFDKRIMVSVAILPLLYDWSASATRTIALSPLLWRNRMGIRDVWREHKGKVLFICLVSPAGYILMLTAMKLAPVTSIAPLRETSILFGAFLGIRMLGEGDQRRRLFAAAVMATGAVSIAFW